MKSYQLTITVLVTNTKYWSESFELPDDSDIEKILLDIAEYTHLVFTCSNGHIMLFPEPILKNSIIEVVIH